MTSMSLLNGLAPNLRGEWIPTFDASECIPPKWFGSVHILTGFSRRFSLLIDWVQAHFIEFRDLFTLESKGPNVKALWSGLI